MSGSIHANKNMDYEVVVIGGGPSGSAAAYHAAHAGYSVALIESGEIGRDKTCGDGLTPRAIHELRTLGLNPTDTYHNNGLKLHGYGGSVTAPWPDSAYGQLGSAMPRTLFDALLLRHAEAAGAKVFASTTARDPQVENGLLTSFTASDMTFRPKWVIVADGVRSPFGKQLGRIWHREEVYGIAARSYIDSGKSHEPWMHSHVELRDLDGSIQPGYGWIFPLGNGQVNLGCGALSTEARPAKLNTKKLLAHYAQTQTEEWELGTPQKITSAMLPMGGAVSNVAGRNWMIIGDAAGGVNPLNGEGIDYGLEMARLAVDKLGARELKRVWPETLREHYGEAFVLARTAARLLTYPQFLPTFGPLALRGPIGAAIMPVAARLMANLITEEDKDVLARLWRVAGRGVASARWRTPLWDMR